MVNAPAGSGPHDAVARALAARRWGRLPWLSVWAVLTAPQIVLIVQAVQALASDPADRVAAVTAGAGLLLLQGLKAWATVPRLSDLGRAPDDVLWAVTPVLNVALFFQMLSRAPSAAVRERRVRGWATQTGALAAWVRAGALLPATAAIGLPTILLGAALAGDGGAAFVDLVFARTEGEAGDGVFEVLALASGAIGLFTLLQLARRGRATRASWLPALLLLPLVLLTTAVAYRDATMGGAGPILLYLVGTAWDLGPVALVGGAMSALWIAAAGLALDGAPAGWSEALERARARWLDVAVVWAGRYQIVQVGAEVVIPGIWFAVSWAFADWIAARPDGEAAFAGSSRRVTGARGRVFKVLLLYFLVAQGSMLVTIFGVLGLETGTGALFDPSLLPPGVATLSMIGPWFASWWCTIAMGIVYRERDALLRAREAQATARAAAEG